MKFVKSNIYQGIHAQTGHLADIKEIVQTDDSGNVTATLDQVLDGLQTDVDNAVTQNMLNSAVSTAVTNALSSANYLQSSNLKTLTINGGDPIPLVKDGINNTISITTGSGSGSGSTVTYTKDAVSGVRAGIIKIDGVNNDIYVRFADDNNSGCLSVQDYNLIRRGSYINTSSINSVNDDLVYSVFDDLGSKGGKVALLSYSNQTYFVYLMALAPLAFTAEGFIKWENNAFSLDSNKVFRKYLIVQSTNAASSRVVTLISSSDMFEYTSNTNTLSITTE